MSAYVFSDNHEGIFGDSQNKVVRLGPDGAKYPIRVHMDRVDIGPKTIFFESNGQLNYAGDKDDTIKKFKSLDIGDNYNLSSKHPNALNITRDDGFKVMDLTSNGIVNIYNELDLLHGKLKLGDNLKLEGYQENGFQIKNEDKSLFQIDGRGKLGFPSIESTRMDTMDIQFKSTRLDSLNSFASYYGSHGDTGYSMNKDDQGNLTWNRGKIRHLEPTLQLTSSGDVKIVNDTYSFEEDYIYKKQLKSRQNTNLCLLDSNTIGRINTRRSQIDVHVSTESNLLDLRISETSSNPSSTYLVTCKSIDTNEEFIAIYSNTLFKGEDAYFTGISKSNFPMYSDTEEYEIIKEVTPNKDTSERPIEVLQNADTYLRHGRLAVQSSYPLENSLEIYGDTLIYSNQANLLFKHASHDQNNAIIFAGADEKNDGREGIEAASIRYWDSSDSLVLEANNIEGKGDVYFNSNVTTGDRIAVNDDIRPSYTWEINDTTGMYHNNGISWCVNDIDAMHLDNNTLSLLNGSPFTKLNLGDCEIKYTNDGSILDINGNIISLYSHAKENYMLNKLYTGNVNNVRNVLDDGEGNVTIKGHTSNLGGSLISVMNDNDGGIEYGIRMRSITDSDWGIYLGKSKSMSGSLTPALYNENESTEVPIWMLRNRAPDSDTAFMWENSTDTGLMTLHAKTGDLHLLQGDAYLIFKKVHT
jgi:hypothetical protein